MNTAPVSIATTNMGFHLDSLCPSIGRHVSDKHSSFLRSAVNLTKNNTLGHWKEETFEFQVKIAKVKDIAIKLYDDLRK